MKCATLRRLLADGGPAALEGNHRAEDHLVDCDRCLAVLEAMAEVDRLLPELGKLDVADEVVERLLARPELLLPSGKNPSAAVGRLARLRARVNATSPKLARIHPLRWAGRVIDHARRERLRWGMVAVPAVILVGLVSVATMRLSDNGLTGPQRIHTVKQVKFKQPPSGAEDRADETGAEERERRIDGLEYSGGGPGTAGASGRSQSRQRMLREIEGQATPVPDGVDARIPDPTPDEPEFSRDDSLVLGIPDAPAPPSAPELSTVTGSLIPRADRMALSPVTVSPPSSGTQGQEEGNLRSLNRELKDLDAVAKDEAQYKALKRQYEETNGKKVSRADAEVADEMIEQAMERSFEGVVAVTGSLIPRADLEALSPVTVKEHDAGNRADFGTHVMSDDIDSEAPATAERFLAARELIEGLEFREARGYWANTYVPGDQTLRRLKTRLDRAVGGGLVGSLHEGSRQITQPFDPPEGAALAVYLHADRNGVEARERILVQVGLKGTARRSGRRPAMNVGLVLDLRGELTPEVGTSMRALLHAVGAAAELGDRFSLTVAGRPGGTILPPGDFRRGPLTVALADVFGDEPMGEVLSLDQAAAEALAMVRADDDPNAPLGSSALVVITAQPLGAHVAPLAAMAHQSAVNGVPWSVIGIDQKINLAELDALVLAGQGNRRLFTTAAEADALVGRELAAVSRVVARAVRLRIRLAPGVQLVDVIGSRRLDEDRAQAVRDAEQAIDQRLSRNLGIQADRGLDEEGIQIVIPSFYADGAHVVLLDVVAPGPGPVADVTVRYKDVVHMRNGVARAHLRLGRSVSSVGPLERNVLANLLATEVASRLDAAADRVAVGDVAAAGTILSDALDLVRGVVALVEGLSQNPDLADDIRMLSGYLEAVSELSAGNAEQLELAADSLRYAGWLKILPPPMSDDESNPHP